MMKIKVLKLIKWALHILCFISAVQLWAQTGVGINTTTPTEELDVNGNVAISGAIKPGGLAGTQGQVLQMQTGGTMAWVDFTKYKNFKSFKNVGNTVWTIPSGVSTVMVEMWAGGGSGYIGGGGGAGSYVLCKFNTGTATSITFTVGAGAPSTTGSSGNAQDSKVSIGTSYILALAGGNAFIGYTGAGGQGALLSSSLFAQYIEIPGEAGSPRELSYQKPSSTKFYEVFIMGNGGSSPNRPTSAGKGAFIIMDGSTIVQSVSSTSGYQPGGGGGGDQSKSIGGDGMIIVYW